MSERLDPAPELCPLCGKANACANETERTTGRPQPPCWCSEVNFSAQLLEQVPADKRRLACICRACALTR